MKKSKFTETQIVSILKQADAGVPVKDICAKRASRRQRITSESRSDPKRNVFLLGEKNPSSFRWASGIASRPPQGSAGTDEVQSGSYFGEDDSVRFEDVYGRSG